jgi:sulfite exporter TauE/SafE
MNDKPDILEKVIRFICGAILGVIFGFIYGIQFGQVYKSTPLFYVILGIFIVLFGLLAMKFGDKFWKNVLKFPWT